MAILGLMISVFGLTVLSARSFIAQDKEIRSLEENAARQKEAIESLYVETEALNAKIELLRSDLTG
ncbi:MAG: hypothetical protein WBC34_19110 [Thiofilum sp.]